jgi:3-oxoacyl-[acyl-carrier-protein] synthase-3
MALQRAGLNKEDIGLVISGSSASDNVSPAEASTVAAELEIDVPCVDMNSACTSFGMQVHFISLMRPEAPPPYVLLVNPENLTRCVNYSDRKSAVLFGDGSSAAIVSATVPACASFTSCAYESKPTDWDKVAIPRMGYFQQDGNAVQGFAIRKTTEAIRVLQKSFAVNGNRFLFIGHQANLGMLETVCERSGITRNNHWHNVEYFGNTGRSGAPTVLIQHWGDLRPGDHAAIAIVGAGLSWVHMMLQVREH